MSSEQEIESELQRKGLNAPRLSPTQIDAMIRHGEYHVFNNKTTVCCLTLRNGFTVVGYSSCVSPENFDPNIGTEVAYRNAREQIWQLEGYLLQQQLFDSRDGV